MRKVREQALKDYVLFPALTGPLFPLTLAGNAIANLVRNVWAFNIIFCGHFPAGVETFTEEECQDENGEESRGHWYYRQVLGSANITGSKLFHIMSRQPVAPDRAPPVPGPAGPALPGDRGRDPEICERYGLEYTTGPLHKQLFSVAKKICRLALPGSAPAPEPTAGQPSPLAA